MTEEVWDAIVIGSGLGGLTAGAAFAKRGKRVLVLERLAGFGGAATVYRHGALTMEASLHETDGDTLFGAQGPFSRLGLAERLEPLATEIFYDVRGGGLPEAVQVPHGLDAARDAVCRALPESRRNLTAYFKELKRLYRSFADLEALGARGPSVLAGLILSGRIFEVLLEARRTLGRRFNGLFGRDELAKMVLGAPLAYFDDDPAKLSFLAYAGVWSRYVESGSYYLKGGSAALTRALLATLEAAGGVARGGCDVRGILTAASGRVAGVAYADAEGVSREARAPVVFGNAAPAHLADLLPDEAGAALRKSVARYEPSISLFTLSLGFDRPGRDFGMTAYSTFVFPDEMKRFADYPKQAAAFAAAPAGALPPYALVDFGRLDSGLRRAGEPYLVSITGVDRLAWWQGLNEAEEKARREAWCAALIADMDRRFPGSAAAVVQAELATARTMKSYLGTPQGEVYGFRPTPARLFSRPPSAATPVKGLWLSSAYTVSGGYAGAMQGGLMAADAALRS
ncbi:MAG: FAD-dependent oxidoreductase [Rhodospirillales bacterium]